MEINAFKVDNGIGLIINDVTEKILAESKFTNLMESAPDAMVIINKSGKIELVNKQTEVLFGYKREELLEAPIEILMPNRFRQEHPQYRKNYFSHTKVRPVGQGMELWAVRKNGTEFPVEISLSPFETTDEVLVSAAIRDVTERMNSQELIKNYNIELNTTNEELQAPTERTI